MASIGITTHFSHLVLLLCCRCTALQAEAAVQADWAAYLHGKYLHHYQLLSPSSIVVLPLYCLAG
jgi:hypothetical protein